jgi:hypothetical protein
MSLYTPISHFSSYLLSLVLSIRYPPRLFPFCGNSGRSLLALVRIHNLEFDYVLFPADGTIVLIWTDGRNTTSSI